VADLSDVETTLVGVLAGIIYPAPYNSGDYQASNALAAFPPPTSTTPAPPLVPIITKTYRGWPEEATMDADLAIGRAHVSVFPEQGMTQITTRYFPVDDAAVEIPAATLGWTVAGNVATLTGTVTVPQNIAIVVDGFGIAYAVQANDTLPAAAAALAALISPKRTVNVVGAAITIPGAHTLIARVGVWAATQAEVRRQKQGFRVSIWAATPAARDVLASLVDMGISGLKDAFGNLTEFFPLSDGTTAHITYRTTYIDDRPEKARLWRRDLCYMIEYAVNADGLLPTLIVPTESVQAGTTALTTVSQFQPPKFTTSF
jgi:hypothetical protein